MPFSIPEFPLPVAVHSGGLTTPASFRLLTVGNLAFGKRVMTQFWPWGSEGQSGVFACLLLPAATDIRDFSSGLTGADAVEVPAGSKRWYLVDYVDDLGKGFPNEHRFALMEKLIPWPTPIP